MIIKIFTDGKTEAQRSEAKLFKDTQQGFKSHLCSGRCHSNLVVVSGRVHVVSPVTQSCLTLCNPIDCSTPGLPVHHQLPKFTQTHVHWLGDDSYSQCNLFLILSSGVCSYFDVIDQCPPKWTLVIGVGGVHEIYYSKQKKKKNLLYY